MPKHFIEFNKLSKEKIRMIASDLKRTDKSQLKASALKSFSDYCNADLQTELPKSSLEFDSLLGVKNSVLVVTFELDPFKDTNVEGAMGGLAKVIEGKPLIPIVFLMPYKRDTTVEHEKIHICQYLQRNLYPLKEDQKALLLSKSLLDNLEYLVNHRGREAATDFLINSTCCKTWIEMEAYYHSEKGENSNELIKSVCYSADPIKTLENGGGRLNWDKKNMEKAALRFSGFCERMEKEVSWVKDLVIDGKYDCLHDFIFEMQDELETDRICGPIEDFMEEYKEDCEEEFGVSDDADFKKLVKQSD